MRDKDLVSIPFKAFHWKAFRFLIGVSGKSSRTLIDAPPSVDGEDRSSKSIDGLSLTYFGTSN